MTQQVETCTIVTGPIIAVHSPYNRAFAYLARMSGGTWDRDSKLWKFRSGHTVETLTQTCSKYYANVVVSDSIPVAETPVVADHGHVGTIGEKLTVRVTVSKVSDFANKYGAIRCHTMVDAEGHVFTWFASSARYESGQTLTLEGKVKKHDTYKGQSQTVLTRCKKIG